MKAKSEANKEAKATGDAELVLWVQAVRKNT
jgi:hypothetical protein